ncbi:uncharacterized protein LOC114472552 [Gouania willdenowi]|uniref:uncharacterized protein LOC114472552 n=1 Tax=Gouania willdenowi TaxID=441366 RepID=UPI0010551BA3|nr:uncharacterized protein LOC114472552 [Gouania willdenowi]
MENSVATYNSGDTCKAEEEKQKSPLSEKMKNLEEENQILMMVNKELAEKEVSHSLKAQMNTDWVKNMCSELEKKEQKISSLTAAFQQANAEVERLESERCDFNSMKMRMTTELEKKNEDLVVLKKAHHKVNTDWQHMEQELCLKERDHKDTVAQMEAKWETMKETLITSHETMLSNVCSQLQALHKDVELHERNAAEATKQLQEKDATIHAMETMFVDLQKKHLTLTTVKENQQLQIDLLVEEGVELKELARMTDKQKARRKKEQDKAEKKSKKKEGKLGSLRNFICCFACCKECHDMVAAPSCVLCFPLRLAPVCPCWCGVGRSRHCCWSSLLTCSSSPPTCSSI